MLILYVLPKLLAHNLLVFLTQRSIFFELNKINTNWRLKKLKITESKIISLFNILNCDSWNLALFQD
jgi:hypothetical protein